MLFDEIEKADDSLWQLGVLDKGTLTRRQPARRFLPDRGPDDIESRCGRDDKAHVGRDGILTWKAGDGGSGSHGPEDLPTANEAAKKKFTPEFMNRIDKVVVFRTLTRDHLREIVDLELDGVRNRIVSSQPGRQFMIHCSDSVKEFLLDEGTDPRYGARHLKRAIERHLVFPLSNLIATGQIELGDLVKADLGPEGRKLKFIKVCATSHVSSLGGYRHNAAESAAAGLTSTHDNHFTPTSPDAQTAH